MSSSVSGGNVVPRSARALTAEAQAVMEPVYRQVIEDLPVEFRNIAKHHIGWWDIDGRLVSRPGRMIRPALVLGSARAAGSDVNERVVRAAVAVELVHGLSILHGNSLLHGDATDGYQVRRQQPSAWAVFGSGPAALIGDRLLTTAIREMDAHEMRVLAKAVQELRIGQSAGQAFEARDDVTVDEGLAMVEAKTGALLGAACELGALAAGSSEETAGYYRRYGRHLGIASQLIEDALDIWGNPSVTGKPVGSDISSRKKSLPVIAALGFSGRAADKLIRLYAQPGSWHDTPVPYVASLIEAAGARAWAHNTAEYHLRAAMTALVEAASAETTDLQTLAALITRRAR